MRSEFILPKDKGLPPLDELSFGKWYTPYMYVRRYRQGKWEEPIICEYDLFALDPASQALHYGQLIFEGMKAYYNADLEKVFFFRPEENARRYARSARRLCMPPLSVEDFMASVTEAVRFSRRWIPPYSEAHPIQASLYIRPFMIGTTPKLGVKAAEDYAHAVITSPSGPYFATGMKPIRLKVEEEFVRAAPGGTGDVKCAGNYAASLLAGQRAAEEGYQQVLWLDAIERRYIEEVGAMNVFMVIDGKLVTPELTGSILPGVTRSSILTMARARGIETEERHIPIEELVDGIGTGRVTEVFGSGTAAVITPVGVLGYRGEDLVINDQKIGPVAKRLYDELVHIQYGVLRPDYAADWVREVSFD